MDLKQGDVISSKEHELEFKILSIVKDDLTNVCTRNDSGNPEPYIGQVQTVNKFHFAYNCKQLGYVVISREKEKPDPVIVFPSIEGKYKL